MIESSTERALQELVSLGLIATQPAARLLSGGNTDRRDQSARTSWRVNLSDGRPVRLLLGSDLGDLAQRQTAFARACPELIPVPVFHQRLTHEEAFAELFIEGDTLESAARESPARVQADFARTCALLAGTTRTSTETERQAEWLVWTDSIAALALWTPPEKSLLETCLWPRLYPLLCATPPARRWTNGDLTSENILLDQAGQPHLIDHEFAHETHFYSEDAARFHTLSPAAREQPSLFSAYPPPGPAWHLFFWLRQLGLESTHNSRSYQERMRPIRLGEIRRLGEILLGCQFAGWSVPAATLHHTLEFARWEQTDTTALRLSGWCHVPATGLRHIQVTQGDQLLVKSAPSSRPDVQAHFAGAPGARATGYSLAVPLHEFDAPLILSAVTVDGAILPFHSCLATHLPGRGPWVEDYSRWAARYDPDPLAPATELAGPLFSVLVPVYNTPLPFLEACLQSIRQQHYLRWELCIVDDGSSDPTVPDYLKQLAGTDPRIRLQLLPTNGGIARASNAALALAEGDFVVMVDHDDILRPHALLELARYLNAQPDTDALYSDEDKLSPEGQRIEPSFKPDFSPEYLLGVMYAGHVLCVRTSVARASGGFDSAYDGMQDYEFFLRVTEYTRRIGHLPRILYHWRQSPSSSSLHGNIKGNIDNLQSTAVLAHLQRLGRTEHVKLCGCHRVQLYPTWETSVEIVHAPANGNPLPALTRTAHTSEANILVLITTDVLTATGHWLRDLGNLAASADSGLIAPLLISPMGLVLESGLTTGPTGTVPIMRGFDPRGDGCMGSLLCTREVAAVSPACCAIRRELLLNNPPAANETWLGYSQKLRASGLFHRVCPTARVQFNHTPNLSADWIGKTSQQDPFFNPHYDVRHADYTLARPPPHFSDTSSHR